jgi:LacI family transcriptional regulator
MTGTGRTGAATVYDVAALAGVSIKTVSRVVTGAGAVSEQTRTKVLEAVAALHYLPSAAARSLKTGVGDAIGVVVDSIADPFFAALTAAIEDHALAQGLSVVIGSTGRDPHRARGQVERLAQQRVRGIVLAPAGGEASYLPGVIRHHPVVCIDRRPELAGLDLVRVADRAAARRGVAHLVAHGHRRIAFLGDTTEVSTIALRRQGYRDALRAAGVDPDPAFVVDGTGEAATAAAATESLLAGRRGAVTAIFASNPRAAVGVVGALHTLGRTDVAVVSFGDFPLAAALSPSITVIDQDPFHVGRAAADRLLARLDGDDGPPADVRIPTPLIVRGSGELPPTR